MQLSYIDKIKNLEFDKNLMIATGISKKIFQLIKNGELYLSDSEQNKLDKYLNIHQKKELKKNIEIEKGKDPKITKIALDILAIILISLFFTGFGYQPWWLFFIILILGLVVTLPACYSNYFWSMNYNRIIVVSYSQNDLKKLLQLLKIKKKSNRIINYNQIQNAKVMYTKIVRISPFNFNPDILYLSLNLKNGETIKLDLGNVSFNELNSIYQMLNYNDINVLDKQKVLLTLKNNENLFSHFHKKWATL